MTGPAGLKGAGEIARAAIAGIAGAVEDPELPQVTIGELALADDAALDMGPQHLPQRQRWRRSLHRNGLMGRSGTAAPWGGTALLRDLFRRKIGWLT